jgi:hypothetical protein
MVLGRKAKYPKERPTEPRNTAVVVCVVLLLLVGGCAQNRDEFEGQGRIRGSLRLGDQTLKNGWVEMIELSGLLEERCNPGECGLSAEALSAGVYWNPGRWRVIAPRIKGWNPPDSIEIVVRPGELTSFEFRYERES